MARSKKTGSQKSCQIPVKWKYNSKWMTLSSSILSANSGVPLCWHSKWKREAPSIFKFKVYWNLTAVGKKVDILSEGEDV
jgi:hypothetical protein